MSFVQFSEKVKDNLRTNKNGKEVDRNPIFFWKDLYDKSMGGWWVGYIFNGFILGLKGRSRGRKC